MNAQGTPTYLGKRTRDSDQHQISTSSSSGGSKSPISSDTGPVPRTPTAPTVRDDWKHQLGMSPLRNTPISVNDTTERMSEAGLQDYMIVGTNDGESEVSDEQKIAYFLFGAFGRDAKDLIDKCRDDPEAKKRMMDILQKDSDVTGRQGEMKLWSTVQKVIICYEASSEASAPDEAAARAVTIFQGKKMPAVLRIQASKNCYQHAVCGALGYKIAHSRGDNNFVVQTVDTPKAVRHHYGLAKLRNRVVLNKGGSSLGFLKTLLSSTTTGSELSTKLPDELDRIRIIDYFRDYGPALISRFSTDDYFRNKDNCRPAPPADYDEGKYIPQFDRVNGSDVCTFASLGEMTEENETLLASMKNSNQTQDHNVVPAGRRNNQTHDRDVVPPAVSMSSSGSPSTTGSRVNPGSGVAAFLPKDESEGIAADEDDDDDDDDDDVNNGEGAGGLHAMIAIGARSVQQDDGQPDKTFILIQNTHRHLPIFEASIAYLKEHLQHKGKLSFLHGNLTAKPELPLIQQQGLCLESSSADDMAEDYDEEEEAEEAEEPYDSDDLEGE